FAITRMLFSVREFSHSKPCHARRSWIFRNSEHNLSACHSLHNDSSHELLKNSSVVHPKLSSRRQLSALHVWRHTASPFLVFFCPWLLLTFLPYSIFISLYF